MEHLWSAEPASFRTHSGKERAVKLNCLLCHLEPKGRRRLGSHSPLQEQASSDRKISQ